MEFVDTHCHIHEARSFLLHDDAAKKRFESAGSPSPDHMVASAVADGVTRMIVVGTTVEDSEAAAGFAGTRDHVWASVGLHPHEAEAYAGDRPALERFAALVSKPKVVAVGECGLDYYHNHAGKAAQETVLRFQVELAQEHGLPLSFHVRDAFDDFWTIIGDYPGVRGVVHSFSSTRAELDRVLDRGLAVGLNGIVTFMKDEEQIAAVKSAPLDGILLETDAPFLTPTPYRGKMCEPKHVRVTAEFLADLRGEPIGEIAARTTANALRIFNLKQEHLS